MIEHETHETWAAALDPQHLQNLETDFIVLFFFFPMLFFACVVFIGFLCFCNGSSKLKQEGHKKKLIQEKFARGCEIINAKTQ